MEKRRFKSEDFDNDNHSGDILGMDDVKTMFKEFVIHKMERDFEEMLKKYYSKKLR